MLKSLSWCHLYWIKYSGYIWFESKIIKILGCSKSSTQLSWEFSEHLWSGFWKSRCPTIGFPIITRARNTTFVGPNCTLCVSPPYRGNGFTLLRLYLSACVAYFAKYTPKQEERKSHETRWSFWHHNHDYLYSIHTFFIFVDIQVLLNNCNYLCLIHGHVFQLTAHQSCTCRLCPHLHHQSHEKVFPLEFLWHLEFSLTVSFSFDTNKEKDMLLTKKMDDDGNSGDEGNRKSFLTYKTFPKGPSSVSCWLIQWLCLTTHHSSQNLPQSDTLERVYSEGSTVKEFKHKHTEIKMNKS